METNDLKSIVNIQNKFDKVTETLNIFDMSFLVSGSAILGVCLYAFPRISNFFIHGNHLFLSVLLCILFSYIFGLICRMTGKYIAYLLTCAYRKLTGKKENDVFDVFLKKDGYNAFVMKPNKKGDEIEKMTKDMAYSYMWMRLDTSRDANCRNRFLYVSRIWVLRAIYEGLIPSVILLSAAVLYKENFSITAFGDKENVQICIMMAIVLLMLLLLCVLVREINHCDETLKKEIVIAYYDFFGKKRQNIKNRKTNLQTTSRNLK